MMFPATVPTLAEPSRIVRCGRILGESAPPSARIVVILWIFPQVACNRGALLVGFLQHLQSTEGGKVET